MITGENNLSGTIIAELYSLPALGMLMFMFIISTLILYSFAKMNWISHSTF